MTPRGLAVLTDQMEAFLRVPKVTWEEWQSLDEDTRVALLAASRRLEVERAITAARALSGPEGVVDLLSEIDGGDTQVALAVGRAIDAYSSRPRSVAGGVR
jgi:hypothetical protein